MTCQPYKEPKVHITYPKYQIHADIKRGKNTYISLKRYKYFFLVVYGVINFTFSKFMKKKSEALPIFIDLITLFKKQYNMKICIFYNNFEKFNLATVKVYFAQKKIKQETSIPYIQEQNNLVN